MQAKPFKTGVVDTDVIISGAGPAGLTLSLLLAGAGLKTVLIDAEKPSSFDLDKPSGRTAALLNGSVNILRETVVWKDLATIATPLRAMRIIDDAKSRSGKVTKIDFLASDIGQEQFGHNVPNAALRKALLSAVAKTENIIHLAPTRLQSYTVDKSKVRAVTDEDVGIDASVIIGTDGRNSAVRAIAGINADIRDYEQTAMTCFITHSKPHHFTSTEFHRPGGPFTLVPMPGNASSIVWVEKTEDAKKFLSMKHGEYQQAIQDRSRGLVGTVTLASTPESWPLMYLYAEDIIAPRAVLAAEAAHVLSPLGAQGLNLSFRDVAALAETLVDAARLGEDIGSAQVLSRYQARRTSDMRLRVHGIDHYNRAVANDLSAIRDIKRLGLSALDKIPALKDIAMRQGLSPYMDSGRLLSGRAL